jgi:hypothetical protein
VATLSREQIAGHAKAAGFAGEDVNIAVAVALAESGGRTDAHNKTPPDDSYGLWQINMLGALGPDRRKRYNLNANTDLFDPATNARVAKGIHNGSGWSAWTTYTRGTYKRHLSPASDTPTETPARDSSAGGGITGAVNAFGQTVFTAASNFAGIIVAVVLLILGVVLLSRNIIPIGRVAKIAKTVGTK